jgi:DNA-binding PadR family transcriptional regulator
LSPRPTGLFTSAIIQAIEHGHRHGADIMNATGQGGGTVYKVLRRLEERGLIRGMWEDAGVAERERRPRRRYYRLTAAGRTELAASVERYRELRSGPVTREARATRGR